MNIAEYQDKEIARLKAKHKRLKEKHLEQSRLDQLAHFDGSLCASEVAQRHTDRMAELAKYENQSDIVAMAKKKAEDAEKRHLRKLRVQRVVNLYGYLFPSFNDFLITDGQKAALIGLMMHAKAKGETSCAKEWIAKKVGISVKTVQTALHYLAQQGVLSIRERRLKGKRMSLWNIYRIKCERVLRWAEHHFISIKGEVNDPHPTGYNFDTTGEKQKELFNKNIEVETNNCRQKAERYEVFAGPEAIDTETFELVAKAGLDKIGHEVPDDAEEQDLIKILDDLRDSALPDLKEWAWNKGRINHGERKPRLAVLEMLVLKDARLRLPDDETPWNEKMPIRNPAGYVAAMLYRKTARPELTLATMLVPFGIYDLPTQLVRLAKKRRDFRKKLRPFQSSAA